MAIETQSHTESGVIQSDELDVLRAILEARGEHIGRSEISDIANDIVGFFEAFEDSNDDVGADDYA